jgi:uncharacterized membrane protein YgdD (TMEM256/DUF423 family)
MQANWIAIGALGCALAVGMGAFGAHGLRARLDAEALALWETGARYLMYGALALLAIGVYGRQSAAQSVGLPAGALTLGTLIFALTLAGLALGGPRWLGAVTPLGGLLMILGLILFAWRSLNA